MKSIKRSNKGWMNADLFPSYMECYVYDQSSDSVVRAIKKHGTWESIDKTRNLTVVPKLCHAIPPIIVPDKPVIK